MEVNPCVMSSLVRGIMLSELLYTNISTCKFHVLCIFEPNVKTGSTDKSEESHQF